MSTIQGTTVKSTCDVSTIFSGALPNQGAIVRVNGIDLVPSPFLNLNLEKYRAGDAIIGGVLRAQLDGYVTGNSFTDVTAQISGLLDLSRYSNCVHLYIQCSGQFIDGFGRITSLSVNEGNQPTWVNLAPYNMEIEIYENLKKRVVEASTGLGLPNHLMLRGYSEELSLSINEDSFNWDDVPGVSGAVGPNGETGNAFPEISGYIKQGNQHVKATFAISAQAISEMGGCTGLSFVSGYGLEGAESAILARITGLKKLDLKTLSSTNYPVSLTSHLNAYASGQSYLEFRSVSINTVENSINVNGEIIYRPSGCANPELFTTMTVDENVDDAGRTLTISGNIRGLYRPTYNNIIGLSDSGPRNCDQINRMESINRYINYLTNNSGVGILRAIGESPSHKTNESIIDTCYNTSSYGSPCASPSPSPMILCSGLRLLSTQISRNYGEGTASYSFVLSNKQNCSIIGAKNVNVDITHDLPADNIVEVIVPGRGHKGVLIQNLCCKSSEKYSINIDATLNSNLCNFQNTAVVSGLKNCAYGLLSNLEKNSGIDVSCWFVVENKESMGNTSYKLSKSYVKPSCP
jgi:hypothetical protein